MKKIKNEKGITLITLVITIIVILILSTVAISNVIYNGVLENTKNSAEIYGQAVLNEKYDLSELEEMLTKAVGVIDTNPGKLEGSGTELEPYEINSIEDLVFFSYDVRQGNTYEGKYLELGLSLDFNSNKSYANPFRKDYGKYGYDGELKALLTSGEGFIPIGTLAVDYSKSFAGTFDAKGFSINNLYMNVANEDGGYIGLFGFNRGKILNLSLLNVNITAESSKKVDIGAISGFLNITGSIKNCIVSGNIINKSESVGTGGIAGYITGSIEECINLCNVNSKGRATGGIIGGTDKYRNNYRLC